MYEHDVGLARAAQLIREYYHLCPTQEVTICNSKEVPIEESDETRSELIFEFITDLGVIQSIEQYLVHNGASY